MARRGRDASPPGKTVYPQHIGQTQMRHKTYSRRACYEWARQGAYKASTNNLVSAVPLTRNTFGLNVARFVPEAERGSQ